MDAKPVRIHRMGGRNFIRSPFLYQTSKSTRVYPFFTSLVKKVGSLSTRDVQIGFPSLLLKDTDVLLYKPIDLLMFLAMLQLWAPETNRSQRSLYNGGMKKSAARGENSTLEGK